VGADVVERWAFAIGKKSSPTCNKRLGATIEHASRRLLSANQVPEEPNVEHLSSRLPDYALGFLGGGTDEGMTGSALGGLGMIRWFE
jgi:hypothetical protein